MCQQEVMDSVAEGIVFIAEGPTWEASISVVASSPVDSEVLG